MNQLMLWFWLAVKFLVYIVVWPLLKVAEWLDNSPETYRDD